MNDEDKVSEVVETVVETPKVEEPTLQNKNMLKLLKEGSAIDVSDKLITATNYETFGVGRDKIGLYYMQDAYMKSNGDKSKKVEDHQLRYCDTSDGVGKYIMSIGRHRIDHIVYGATSGVLRDHCFYDLIFLDLKR